MKKIMYYYNRKYPEYEIETNNDFAKSLQIELIRKDQEIERLHSLYEERCRKIKDYLKLIREDSKKGILCSYNLVEDNIARLCDGLDVLGSDNNEIV